MGFKLVDDGTLDTVLQCEDCGEELRFNPTDDIGEDDRIPFCLDLATSTHECEAEESQEAGEEPEPSTSTSQAGKYILIDPNNLPIINPYIVGLSPLFDDLVEAERTAIPYRAKVYMLAEVE